MCLPAAVDEDQLELPWEPESRDTIGSAVDPLIRQRGDVAIPEPHEVAERLWVLPGDLGLNTFEDSLSDAWSGSLAGDEDAIRITTAFHRIISGLAAQTAADVVLLDLGPNLGAINRAALLACDDLVVPLAGDLFALQGLRTLGPTLREWRRAWQQLGLPNPSAAIAAPNWPPCAATAASCRSRRTPGSRCSTCGPVTARWGRPADWSRPATGSSRGSRSA